MAVEVIEKETNWFSSELSILEAEFEKSKLQVYQDTLLCKRSMVELDLLWKNERLRKNVRVNNKLKEKDAKLQEQLKSLSSELENATSQLQTAQNSLQDEKARHQLEKTELEQKLNFEMETKMEQQRESAIKRENLLQEELKTLQNKQLKMFKEAEDLRTELSKKNVAVKTKAVQARVNVKNTSTMVQVDSQTCEAGVQVEDMALAHDCSRMDGGDVREVNEDLRETSETSKEKKRVTETKGKASKRGTVKESKKDTDKRKKKTAKDQTVPTCKEVDKDEVEENGMFHEEGDNNRKVLRKRKFSQRESVAPQSEAKAMAEKKQTVASTEEELHLEQITAQTDKSAANVLQEDDIPFQYSLTPRRLQTLPEDNQSLEKHNDTTSGSTQYDITCSKEEGNNSTKRSEVALKEFPRLEKSVEDNSNKEVLKNAQEDSEVNTDGFVAMPLGERSVENENVTSEEQKSALIEDVNDLIELHEAGMKLQDEEELPRDSEKTDTDEDIQSHELPDVEDVNKEMRKNGEKGSKRKRKAKQMKSAEGEIRKDEGKIREHSAVESNESHGKRVLRSRVKECHSGVQLDTKKGEKRKLFGPKSRQKRQDSAVETALTEKCKPEGWDFKGRELTILDKSTPESDQLPRETDMSSGEIDRLVDEPRPSRAVMSRTLTSDETSQQPEPEVLRRSNEGNTSDQGRLVLNVNRISTLEETILDNCLHKHEEEGKSPCHRGLHPDQENDNKLDLCSETRNIAPSEEQFQDTDDISASRKRGSDSNEADCNMHFTQQTAKSTSRDTGHSRRHGQDPVGVSNLTAASSKENAPKGKLKSRKKRKPTSSVREVLASADQQSNSDCRTSSTENPSMLDYTKRRKTLFNSRENSLMVPVSNTQISSANTTLSKGRANAGIPPSLSAFMRSFIAPKLKKPI